MWLCAFSDGDGGDREVVAWGDGGGGGGGCSDCAGAGSAGSVGVVVLDGDGGGSRVWPGEMAGERGGCGVGEA